MNLPVLAIHFLIGSIVAQNCPIYPQTVPLTADAFATFISPALGELNAMLQTQQEVLDFPAVVCAVVYDQELVWSNGYGVQNPFDAQSPKPSADSVFAVASVTKTFTALLMMYLRDAGLIDLDDPVTKYIPEFAVKDPYNTNRPITLRQLASHSSGLQSEIPVDAYDMANYTQAEILERIAQTYLLFPQYGTPHYSNLGIALLGRALQSAAGIEYEELMEAKIFGPLGMSNSTFNYSAVAENMAVGAVLTPNGTTLPAEVYPLGWGTPMGGLLTTARDLAKLMSFLFRANETAEGDQVLDSSTINEFLLPVIPMEDGVYSVGNVWEFQYIKPMNTPGYWMKFKPGETLGYRSQIAIVEPLKVGVFCAGTSNSDDSTRSMLTIPALEILLPAFNMAIQSSQSNYTLPSNANDLIGTYKYIDRVYGAALLEIFIAPNGELQATLGNLFSLTLFSSGFDPNVLRVQLNAEEPCLFFDGGVNNEMIYFSMQGSVPATATFVAKQFNFVSKSCSQCS
eukprot:TRINITY_DN6724_c0_g1_i1.p1 TRINITY_DN6724_c0_g1~~TRINITY_DN6724_c0_g1_i1.p1  ORF type:complete len:512 (-),score=105.75 TRINITY_DN6724_c0_g1_i1:76-1611(-)